MLFSRREFLATITGLPLLAPLAGQASGPLNAEKRYALAGTILPGDQTPPLKKHAVLVDRGRIQAVVPALSVKDRPVVCLGKATIMPGVINAHCHQLHSPEQRAQRWLQHGVTSIGDAAAPLAALPLLIDSPIGATATASFSGPMLAPPGGYPLPVHNRKYALVVKSPRQAREAVRHLSDLGAGMIKMSFDPGPLASPWPLFEPGTAEAICDEARKRGMIIRCHVEDLAGLEPALNAGVHTVEHVPHRWTARGESLPVLRKTGGKLEPTAYYQALLERMARDGVILTPTLDVLSRSAWNGPQLHEPVRMFASMSGQIALGNDFPYRRTDSGMPLGEMRLLEKTGLTNAEILWSATRTSAKACGFADRGKLAPKMAADMLVIKGDPLTDLDVMSKPLHVVKDGTFIRQA